MTLKINEIFVSIQGESSLAGFPCVFVRLTGCNLRCSYCDTPYAYEEGEELTLNEVKERIRSYRIPLVEITGGEPLLQAETPKLIHSLLDEGYRVLLETNGSLDISGVDRRCKRIVDVKLPGSGEEGKNNRDNLKALTPMDELKFVLSHKEDYLYAKNTLLSLSPLLLREMVINFSPVMGRLDAAELSSWILQDRLFVRLNLQLHKLIWPQGERGR